jgi:hypothetical protein
MAEPRDMIVPMLKEVRSAIEALDVKVERLHAETGLRLDKVDAGLKSLRNAMTADTLMSKFLLGDFEERLALLESKVERLDPHQP